MKLTTKQFINAASLTHAGFYDYSDTIYIGALKKITIICPLHGSFDQRANDHKTGSRCPKCVSSDRSVAYTLTTTQWVDKAKLIHEEFYNYNKTVYTGNRDKVTIICPLHGSFTQRASTHLSGAGCPVCGTDVCAKKNTKSQSQFIKESVKLHNDVYDYSRVVYVHSLKKVEIICSKHGIFLQLPNSHLQGTGCPSCRSRISKPATHWLQSLNIDQLIVEYRITALGKFVDGYDPSTNTVYLFHGDYWHGNPTIYQSTDFNQRTKCTFGELYQLTLDYEALITNAGYNVVVMWEHDWNQLSD